MKQIDIEYGLSDVKNVAQQLVQLAQDVQVITFTGSLGAGKTTLIANMLKIWGVVVPVVSPTFTYINVYQVPAGKKVYHFDLYRLKGQQDFEQAGFFEYLYQENSICLIEWPEIIMPLLNRSTMHIAIEFLGIDKRLLTASFIK